MDEKLTPIRLKGFWETCPWAREIEVKGERKRYARLDALCHAFGVRLEGQEARLKSHPLFFQYVRRVEGVCCLDTAAVLWWMGELGDEEVEEWQRPRLQVLREKLALDLSQAPQKRHAVARGAMIHAVRREPNGPIA